jgi:hypothetical protein
MVAEFDPLLDLQEQVNQYGPNAFAICNPDWRSSGFGKCLMPWETHAKYWIKPHRGLLVAFDATGCAFPKALHGRRAFHAGVTQHQGRKTQWLNF